MHNIRDPINMPLVRRGILVYLVKFLLCDDGVAGGVEQAAGPAHVDLGGAALAAGTVLRVRVGAAGGVGGGARQADVPGLATAGRPRVAVAERREWFFVLFLSLSFPGAHGRAMPLAESEDQTSLSPLKHLPLRCLTPDSLCVCLARRGGRGE